MLFVALSLALALAPGQTPVAASAASVHPADRMRLLDGKVVADLLVNDLDDLLARQTPRPAGMNETIERLNLCLRAGRRAEAASLIDHLGALKIDPDLTRGLVDFLIGRREIDLAARLIEWVPGSGREFSSIVVGHWLNDARKPREEIDRWLAARGWADDQTRVPPELLADDPLTATDARDRGERAASWNMPARAAALFDRALAMPFTHDDVLNEMRVLAMPPVRSDAEWERRFRSRTRLALAEAYRNAGDASRGQTVLAQLAREDPSIVGDAWFARLAGRAQLASGGREVEQAYRATEPANMNSLEYSMARARYFAGRQEGMSTSDAFERALSLARAERPESRATRRVLQAYDEYLVSSGARARAWDLLRRELESGSRREDDWIFEALARNLRDDDRLVAYSEWIWKALEQRADWEPATMLLEHLVRKTPMDERPAVVNRSLALVANADSGRTLPLARALTRAEEGAAAVPLFRRVLVSASPSERAGIERELTSAERLRLRRQFSSDLQRGDWRSAEQAWSALLQIEPGGVEATFHLSSTASAMVQLADAAAQGGDGADALRFWRRAASLDRTVGLERLAGFPFSRYRAELIAFYQEMARRDSTSWVPAAALSKLRP